MSIAIYTYGDPYKLSSEPFWDEITTCPYFCVSQTLANGLEAVYSTPTKGFAKYGTKTVKQLVDSVYPAWQSTASAVKQHAAIDNTINSGLSESDGADGLANIKRAFLFNREEVFSSIRILCELDVKTDDIVIDELTPEQRFIVDLYKKIKISPASSDLFAVDCGFSAEDVDSAIARAIALDGSLQIPDRVVIHGVHQFTPIMLRTIEELSRYKKVILLFGYQSQYKAIYQTWIDVYSSFDCPITSFGGKEFVPNHNMLESYEGNHLGDGFGRLADGHIWATDNSYDYELIEFDNMTEFASYVADLYSSSRAINPKNPLSAMKEHVYAADSSVNDILKVYFPEQFGERQFLNYPLGHFFIAIANMWDMDGNRVVVDDLNDIRECLMAGILSEEHLGELSTIFDSASALFVGCSTIDDIISRIRSLQRSRRRMSRNLGNEALNRISYYRVQDPELEKFKKALEELQDLSHYFYEDFERRPNNFRAFYRKLKEFLRDQVLDARELDREFEDIVRRVYKRLEEVEDIDASASFECLKSTMSIYLTQEEGPTGGANWIVRNFEQIDGDILRSAKRKSGKEPEVYHFACLSDEDINSVLVHPFPWPLDDGFFLIAQEPVDWKYQVFVKSRKEYRNFKSYALLFGLEFNRAKYKLSYVRRDGERIKTPYSRLTMLGARVVPQNETRLGHRLQELPDISAGVSGAVNHPYDKFDYFRFRICKYRFLLESIIESGTSYKDPFLLSKYLEALLENRVRDELQGLPLSDPVLVKKLYEALDDLERCFPYLRSSERADAINSVRRRLFKSATKGFPPIGQAQRDYMKIRELFLQMSLTNSLGHNVLEGKFEDVSEEELSNLLTAEALEYFSYVAEPEIWCKYCSNRELCAASYAQK